MKINSFFKDIIITFVAQMLVLVSFLFIYGIVAQYYGPAGVGEYSLVKKTVGFLQLVLLLGLEIGLPRYIAMSAQAKRGGYFAVGTFVATALTLVFILFANIYSGFFAELIFGSVDYKQLIVPLSFFLAGINFTALVYCYLQGRQLFNQFNILQLVNIAVVPIVALSIFRNSLADAILAAGVAMIAVALVFSVYSFRDLMAARKGLDIKCLSKELMAYSAGRLAGDFILACIWYLSPMFIVHFASVASAGYLSVGQSLAIAIGSLATPLGMVLLPKVSNLIAGERQEMIKDNFGFFVAAVIQCSIFVCTQLILFSDLILRFWLGSEFVPATGIVRISIFAAGFYLFYTSTRSIIDAVKTRPVNTQNLFISFLVFMVVGGTIPLFPGMFNPVATVNVAFALSLICLGVLTYISLRKIYPDAEASDAKAFLVAVGANIALMAFAFAAKSFIGSLYSLAVFEILLGMAYFAILFMLKSPWTKQVLRLVLKDGRFINRRNTGPR